MSFYHCSRRDSMPQQLCHHNFPSMANVLNCSGTDMQNLLPPVPLQTDWLILTGANLHSLTTYHTYIPNLTLMDLRYNKIEMLSENFISGLSDLQRNILLIDVRDNIISRLPKSMSTLKAVQFKLSGNQLICDCEMLWIADWLANTTIQSGEHGEPVVIDYDEVLCYEGKQKGQAIYTLQAEDMGCLPNTLATSAIISLVCIGTLFLCMFCMCAVALRRWNEIRWFVYRKYNMYIGRKDDNDDIEGMVFDALISYRCVEFIQHNNLDF